MKPEVRAFVDDVRRRHPVLRSPSELLDRRRRADDVVDSLTLAGQSVAEIAAGRVDPADLDPGVLEAFHLQYPNEDFLETVREHAGDHGALAGLVSGMKGKLFELRYVEWLNDGHLPAGHVAQLAADPTQAGFDIIVRDADGQVAELLQAKATASIEYIVEALHRYPGIDVVATHETFDQLSDPELAARVVHSAIESGDLAHDVEAALDAADGGVDADVELPFLAFAVIALQSVLRVSRGEAVRLVALEAAKRSAFSLIAKLASHGIVLATGEPVLGLPASVVTRIALGRIANREEIGRLCADATERRRAQRLRLST